MACVWGKEETKSVTERLPVMKEKAEKIDIVLEQNAEEQLAQVDWEKLNAAISSRLEQAQSRKASATNYPRIAKIAAAILATAAVVFIAVILRIDKPADLQLEEGRRAVVKFIESRGKALVEIKQWSSRGRAVVQIGRSDALVAKTNVEMLDANGGLKDGSGRATWIIISRPVPVYADNGVNNDMMAMICLF